MRHLKQTLFLTATLIANIPTVASSDDIKPVTYDDHIAAIFKRHCLQCHGESKQESGLSLASYAAVIKGGSGGEVVVAGRSNGSRLIKLITAADPDERMPPDNDALPADQIALIKSWIDTGLRQNTGSKPAAARTMGFQPSPTPTNDGPPPMPETLPSFQRKTTIRPFPILALATSPRAPLVAVASYECVDLVDPLGRNILGSLPFPEGEPHVLQFSRSGAVLLAAGGRPVQNGTAVLFDVVSGRRLAELGNETDEIIAADLSADERRVAIGGSGRVVKVFSTENGSLLQTLTKHTDWITAVAFSPDGKLLATGDRTGGIHLWDASSGGTVLPLSEHKAAVRALSWRSDSLVLASCGDDGMIVWWNVTKGWPEASKQDAHPPQRPAGVYGKIANGVLDVAFGPNGELVSCGRDHQVRIWSHDGQQLKSIPVDGEIPANQSHSGGIQVIPIRVGITFDSGVVLSGDSAGQLHSWPFKSAN